MVAEPGEAVEDVAHPAKLTRAAGRQLLAGADRERACHLPDALRGMAGPHAGVAQHAEEAVQQVVDAPEVAAAEDGVEAVVRRPSA
jgi:hypothetical protein